MNRKTRNRWLLAGFLLFAVLASGGVKLYQWYDHRQMIEITREWGRLSPFPASASGLTASTKGSMFTRGFRVHFVAPQSDIEAWLKTSPGTNSAQVDTNGATRVYHIQPGGGAEFAEVTVNSDTHEVSIHVYWS